MMKILVSVGTTKVGSTVQRIIEVDDDEMEDTIADLAWETALDSIDFSYRKIESR